MSVKEVLEGFEGGLAVPRTVAERAELAEQVEQEMSAEVAEVDALHKQMVALNRRKLDLCTSIAGKQKLLAQLLGVDPGGRSTGATVAGSLYARILELLAGDPGRLWRAQEVASELGASRKPVGQALSAMTLDGRILRPSRGVFCGLSDAPPKAVAQTSRDQICQQVVEFVDSKVDQAVSSKQILEHMGRDKSQVYAALKAAVERGDVRRIKQGTYTSAKSSTQIGRRRPAICAGSKKSQRIRELGAVDKWSGGGQW